MRELIMCALCMWAILVAAMILWACYLFSHYFTTGEFAMYPLSPTKLRVLKIIEAELLKPDVWSYRMGVLRHNSKPFIICSGRNKELNLSIPINKKLIRNSLIGIENSKNNELIKEMFK